MNQLIADDVVQQAGRAQSGAIAENFSLQQAENQAVQRLRNSGALPKEGSARSLELLLDDSYEARTGRSAARQAQNQAINRTAATTGAARNAATPFRIQLPTTGQIARSLSTLGRSVASGAGQAALLEGNIQLQGLNDSLNEDIRNQLPNNVQPAWDRIAGPGGALEQWISPPNIAGPREGFRLYDDFQDRIPAGLPPRSQLGQIGQQLGCSIFGIGCPTTEPEGVPNLGSPGVEPPFYGGQSAVGYYVSWQATWHFDNNDPNDLSGGGEFDIPLLGPIGGLQWAPSIDFYGNTIGADLVVIHPGGPTPIANRSIGGDSQWNESLSSSSITGLRRTDGQPDTGGNPAPLPDAGNRPATTPALVNRPIRPAGGAPTLPSTAVPNPATTPLSPTPTAPPDTAPPEVEPPDTKKDSPLSPLNPGFPLIPAIRPVTPPSGQKGFNPSGAAQPGLSQGTGTGTGTSTKPTTPTCFYDSSNIAGRVDRVDTTLNAVNLLIQQQVLGKLDTLDAKLGPQIPNGGVSGFLGKMFDFAKKSWDFLQIDRVLNILTWIGVMHNAYMLSNGLAQTLFSAVGTALDAFGIEDADGGALDVGAIVAKWTDGFFKSIFGVETVDGIKSAWAKYNRIYQAAANILNSVQSMVYSLTEIIETVSNYVGKIGNALKRSGAVLENSFNWMNGNANYTDSKFFRFLQRVQDGVEIVENIFSEVVSIQEEASELYEQSEKFREEIQKEEKKVGDAETAGKTASGGATVTPSDERKPD